MTLTIKDFLFRGREVGGAAGGEVPSERVIGGFGSPALSSFVRNISTGTPTYSQVNRFAGDAFLGLSALPRRTTYNPRGKE